MGYGFPLSHLFAGWAPNHGSCNPKGSGSCTSDWSSRKRPQPILLSKLSYLYTYHVKAIKSI